MRMIGAVRRNHESLGPALSLSSIAAVVLLALAYLTFDVVGVDWFTSYARLTMTLTNSGSLGPQSPVLLFGVRVGKVVSVRNGDDGVQVSMRVRNDCHIPVASTVSIENLSALGEPQVQFTPVKDAPPRICATDNTSTPGPSGRRPRYPRWPGRRPI
ncbi:MCE family protein [Nocardia abscessus]|nr:MCE family protein [Nocardia abscessus]